MFNLLGLTLLLLAQERFYDTPPKVIHRVEAKFTDAARERKASGTVVLSLRVDTDGIPRDIQVVRPLDADLDQQAVLALKQWKLEPATKEGIPVTARATVEINFRRY